MFATVALLVPLGLEFPLLNSDGDVARHLRHGLTMLDQHALIHADPFSFTRPGAPFLGFEYGSQLVLALAHRAGGLAGVAIFAGLLLGAVYALLAAFLLRRGVDPVLTFLVTMASVVLGSGHWLARPHLFTFLGIVLLLGLLEPRFKRNVWLGLPLFAVWANLHGGWLLGLIVIGVYAAGAALETLTANSPSARARWIRETRSLCLLLGLGAIATLLNPHGLALAGHVAGFFADPYIVNNTAEFQSPNFHEPWARAFLLVLLVLLGALALTRRRPTWPRLLLIAAGVGLALVSRRNIPIFALTALPVAALHLAPEWAALPDPRAFRANFARSARQAVSWPWITATAAAMAALGFSHGRIGNAQVVGDSFSARLFPTAVVARARRDGETGRLFTDFSWGGYILYAWPEQKVFIDGGTDFYGPGLLEEYQRIMRLDPGWRERLDHWRIDLLLLKPRSALAHEAMRDGDWQLVDCDSVGALLRRRAAPDTAARSVALSADSAEASLDACAPPSGDGSESYSLRPLGNAEQRQAPRQADAVGEAAFGAQDGREDRVHGRAVHSEIGLTPPVSGAQPLHQPPRANHRKERGIPVREADEA
ncbi:MAG TPA: hypothetical protein VFW66_08855 [Gemmatimonadales bacterium]|nr:hypothetical protein [Gemmatimonadales bacterium]